MLLVGLLTFTYSTILGWSQYGNRAISYLLGKKAVLPCYIVFLLFVFWGCMMVGDVEQRRGFQFELYGGISLT